MQEKHEAKPLFETITDEQTMAAIRYLDPDSIRQSSIDKSSTSLIICLSLIIMLAGALAYIWLYLQTS